jgi:signal transduction histidine kinase
MQGLTDQWIFTDASNRVASYTTLPAGEYTFKVKGSNKQGGWGEEATTLKITILPPWYLTWQAYLLYCVLGIVGIYLFIRLRTQSLMNQAKVLEQNVIERTQQLQNSRDELAEQSKTVSDLLAQKQRLFASVSHEFRTPLTLILSPIAEEAPIDDEAAVTAPSQPSSQTTRTQLMQADLDLEIDSIIQPQDALGSETATNACWHKMVKVG